MYIHFFQGPYALHPGETLVGAPTFGIDNKDFKPAVKPLPVVKTNQAIRLEALLDHYDGPIERKAGDVWQLRGPLTYKPIPEVVSIVRIHC